MEVSESSGVTNELLTSPSMAVPPVSTSYHLYWPAVAPEAVSVTLSGVQVLASVAVGVAKGPMVSTALVEKSSMIVLPDTLHR